MSRRARSDELAWWLFAASLTLSMTLSAQALLALGMPYDAPYGPPIAKLHPGSWLLVLAWLCALARHGNPLAVQLEAARREPLATAYIVCMGLVFFWTIYRHGSSGAAYILQTLWMPALAIFTLGLLGASRRQQTAQLVMALLCLNAALALGEYFLKAHLVPISADQEGTEYFRSSALLGHPLLNANVTMALLPAVMLLPWRLAWRLLAGLLLLCSMLAFGARTALVTGLLVYGAHAAVQGTVNALRGRYSYLQLTGTLAGVMLVGAALAGTVLATGLGERIFSNLKWDNSANVRLKVWEAFDFLHGSDWWLGVPPSQIDRIAVAMGLDPRYEAIENFWIYAYLQFGAIGFVPFIVGMACLIALLIKHSQPAMRGAVFVFFAVASTANALSSKTVSLTLLSVVALATAAPRRAPAFAASPTYRFGRLS